MKIVSALFSRFTTEKRIITIFSWPILNKVVAIVTLASFLLTGVFGQAIATLLQEEQEGGRFKQVYSDYVLPATKGRITAGKYFGSSTVVINIQDLHCHPEVQRNISAILNNLTSKYALSRICLEGAAGPVDLRCFTCIQDRKARTEVLQSLLKKGLLTGVEYFAAGTEKDIRVFGLENEKLYDENSLRLGRIRENKDDIQELLKTVHSNLEQVKEKYYSTRQKNLEKIIAKYRAGKIDTRKFYILLKKYGEREKIDVDRYTNLPGFLALIELEKRLNYKHITLQMSRLLIDLKRQLPYSAYNSILQQTDNFAKTDELYRLLAKMAVTYHLSVEQVYPDLARFFDYLNASRDINPLTLLREEHQMIEEIRLSMAKNQSEREVAFLLDNYQRLDDFLNARISAEDYAVFIREIEQFKVLYACYTGDNTVEELNGYCDLLGKYYRANLSRNESFLKNMLGDRPEAGAASPLRTNGENIAQVVASLQTAKEIVVVVAGGFHSSGVSRLLNQQRISHLEITPNATDDTRFADAVYWEKLEAQNKFLSQAFALKVLAAQPRQVQLAQTAGTYLSVLIDQGVNLGAVQEKIQNSLDGWYQPGNVTFTFSGRDSDDADILRFKLRFGNSKEYAYSYNTKTGEAAVRTKASYSRFLRHRSFQRLLWEAVPGLLSVAVAAALSYMLKDPYQGTAVSGMLSAGLGIAAFPDKLGKKIKAAVHPGKTAENRQNDTAAGIVSRKFLSEYDTKLPGEWVVSVYDTVDDDARAELQEQVDADITPLGFTISTLADVEGYSKLQSDIKVIYRKQEIRMQVFVEMLIGNDNLVKGGILHFVIPDDVSLDSVPAGEDEGTWRFVQKSQILVLTARTLISELTRPQRSGVRAELSRQGGALPPEPALIKLFGPGAGLLANANNSVRYGTSNDMNQISGQYIVVANTDYDVQVSKIIAQRLGLKELDFEEQPGSDNKADRNMNVYGVKYANKVQPGDIRKALAQQRKAKANMRKDGSFAKRARNKIVSAIRREIPAVTRQDLSAYDNELRGEWVASVYDVIDDAAREELKMEAGKGIIPIGFTLSTEEYVIKNKFMEIDRRVKIITGKNSVEKELRIFVENILDDKNQLLGVILHFVGSGKDIYNEIPPAGEDEELWRFILRSRALVLSVRSFLIDLNREKNRPILKALENRGIVLPRPDPALIKLIGPGAGLLSNVNESARHNVKKNMNQISERFIVVANTDYNKQVTKNIAQRLRLKELAFEEQPGSEEQADRNMNIYGRKYANRVQPKDIKRVLAEKRKKDKVSNTTRTVTALLPFAGIFFVAFAIIRHFAFGETDINGTYGLVSAMAFGIVPIGERPDKRKKYQRRNVDEDTSPKKAGNAEGSFKIVTWRPQTQASSEGEPEIVEKVTVPENESAITVERRKLRKYYGALGRRGAVSVSVYGAIDNEAYDELRTLAALGGHPVAFALRNASDEAGKKKLLAVPGKVQIVFRGKPVDIDVFEEQVETADKKKRAAIYYFSSDAIDRSRKPAGVSDEEWNTAIDAQVLALASHQFMMQLQAKSTHFKPRPLVRFVSQALKIPPEEFRLAMAFLIGPEAALLANINEASRERAVRANLNSNVKLEGNKADPEKRMPFVSTITDYFLSKEVYGYNGLNIAAADYAEKDPVTGAFNLGRYPEKYAKPVEELLDETEEASPEELSKESATAGFPAVHTVAERTVPKDVEYLRDAGSLIPRRPLEYYGFIHRTNKRLGNLMMSLRISMLNSKIPMLKEKMKPRGAEDIFVKFNDRHRPATFNMDGRETSDSFWERHYPALKGKTVVNVFGRSDESATLQELEKHIAVLLDQREKGIYPIGFDRIQLSPKDDPVAFAHANGFIPFPNFNWGRHQYRDYQPQDINLEAAKKELQVKKNLVTRLVLLGLANIDYINDDILEILSSGNSVRLEASINENEIISEMKAEDLANVLNRIAGLKKLYKYAGAGIDKMQLSPEQIAVLKSANNGWVPISCLKAVNQTVLFNYLMGTLWSRDFVSGGSDVRIMVKPVPGEQGNGIMFLFVESGVSDLRKDPPKGVPSELWEKLVDGGTMADGTNYIGRLINNKSISLRGVKKNIAAVLGTSISQINMKYLLLHGTKAAATAVYIQPEGEYFKKDKHLLQMHVVAAIDEDLAASSAAWAKAIPFWRSKKEKVSELLSGSVLKANIWIGESKGNLVSAVSSERQEEMVAVHVKEKRQEEPVRTLKDLEAYNDKFDGQPIFNVAMQMDDAIQQDMSKQAELGADPFAIVLDKLSGETELKENINLQGHALTKLTDISLYYRNKLIKLPVYFEIQKNESGKRITILHIIDKGDVVIRENGDLWNRTTDAIVLSSAAHKLVKLITDQRARDGRRVKLKLSYNANIDRVLVKLIGVEASLAANAPKVLNTFYEDSRIRKHRKILWQPPIYVVGTNDYDSTAIPYIISNDLGLRAGRKDHPYDIKTAIKKYANQKTPADIEQETMKRSALKMEEWKSAARNLFGMAKDGTALQTRSSGKDSENQDQADALESAFSSPISEKIMTILPFAGMALLAAGALLHFFAPSLMHMTALLSMQVAAGIPFVTRGTPAKAGKMDGLRKGDARLKGELVLLFAELVNDPVKKYMEEMSDNGSFPIVMTRLSLPEGKDVFAYAEEKGLKHLAGLKGEQVKPGMQPEIVFSYGRKEKGKKPKARMYVLVETVPFGNGRNGLVFYYVDEKKTNDRPVTLNRNNALLPVSMGIIEEGQMLADAGRTTMTVLERNRALRDEVRKLLGMDSGKFNETIFFTVVPPEVYTDESMKTREMAVEKQMPAVGKEESAVMQQESPEKDKASNDSTSSFRENLYAFFSKFDSKLKGKVSITVASRADQALRDHLSNRAAKGVLSIGMALLKDLDTEKEIALEGPIYSIEMPYRDRIVTMNIYAQILPNNALMLYFNDDDEDPLKTINRDGKPEGEDSALWEYAVDSQVLATAVDKTLAMLKSVYVSGGKDIQAQISTLLDIPAQEFRPEIIELVGGKAAPLADLHPFLGKKRLSSYAKNNKFAAVMDREIIIPQAITNELKIKQGEYYKEGLPLTTLLREIAPENKQIPAESKRSEISSAAQQNEIKPIEKIKIEDRDKVIVSKERFQTVSRKDLGKYNERMAGGIGISVYSEVDDTARNELKAEVDAGVKSVAITFLSKETDIQKFIIENRKKGRIIEPVPQMNLKLRYRKKNSTLKVYAEKVYPNEKDRRKRAVILYVVDENNEIYRDEYPYQLVEREKEMEEIWDYMIDSQVLALSVREIVSKISYDMNFRQAISAFLGLEYMKFIPSGMKLIGPKAALAADPNTAVGSYTLHYFNEFPIIATNDEVYKIPEPFIDALKMKVTHFVNHWYDLSYFASVTANSWETPEERKQQTYVWKTLRSVELNIYSIFSFGALIAAVALISQLFLAKTVGTSELSALGAAFIGMVWTKNEKVRNDGLAGNNNEKQTGSMNHDQGMSSSAVFTREQVYEFLDKDDPDLKDTLSFYIFGERGVFTKEEKEERENAQVEELERQLEKGIFTMGVELGDTGGEDILKYTEENGYEPLSNYMNARSLHYQYAPENINIEAAKRIFHDENNPVAQLLRDEFVNEDAITAEKLATVLNTFLTTYIPMPSLEHLELNRDALDALPRLQDKDKEVRKAARKTVKRAVIQKLVPGITQKPEITVAYKKQTIPLYVLVKKIPAQDGSERDALLFTVIIPSDSKFPPAAPDGVDGEEWKNYVYGQVLGLAARKIYSELSDQHSVILRKNILALLGIHDDKFEVKKLKLAGENAVLAANLPLATSNIFKYFDFEKIDTIAAMRTALAVPSAVFKKASRRTTRLDYVPADIFFRRHHHDEMKILFPGSKAQPLSSGTEEARTEVPRASGRLEAEIAAPATAPLADDSGELLVAGGKPVITSETLDTLDPYLSGKFVVNVYQTYNEEAQEKVKKQLLGGIKTAVIVHDRVPRGMTIDEYALQNDLVRIDKIPLTFSKDLGGKTRYVREKAVAVYFRKRSRDFPLYVGETIASTADGVEMRAPVFHVIDDGHTVINRSKRPGRLRETRWNDTLDMIILSHAAHRLIMMMISESQRYGRFQKLVAALAGIQLDTNGTVDVRPALIKLDGYKAGLTAKAKLIVSASRKNGFFEIPGDIPIVATNNESFSLSGQEASLIGLGDPVDVQEVVNKYANIITIDGLKKLLSRDPRPSKDDEKMKVTASLHGTAPLVSGQRRVSQNIQLAINAARGVNLQAMQKMTSMRVSVTIDGFLQKYAPEFHGTLSVNLWNATDAALLAGPEAEIVEENGRSWYFHAEREKLQDTLRAQSGLGLPAVAFSLLKGDAETVDRLPRLAHAFSFPLFYQGKYHEMEVLIETVVSEGGQKSLILYLFDPKGTITHDGMPGGEDPDAWVRAIDGQVLALGAQEALARIRWDKFTGSAISRQMDLPYSRKALTPGIVHLNGAETAAVLAVVNTAGFSGDTSFGSAPFIARFEDDLIITNETVDALGLRGMPAPGRDISMKAFAASFADRLLPSVLDSASIRKVLPSISNDLLAKVSGQGPENQEKVALLMARVPSRRKKVEAGVSDIKPGIVFSFALKDPGPFLHKTSLGSLKANLDDLAAAGPSIALVEDILNPNNPVQQGHPVFSVPIQYEGLRLKGNNRRKQQGAVQETVREEIRVALTVKGKRREDIATLFNYPVGNRAVSPEAIEEMIAMGFAGVQLDFTAGVQNLDEDALRKIRERNPDAIILFVPPADPAEKMQLQKALASARLAATPVEPFWLGSPLAGIPENGNIGLRVYAESDDAAEDPEDIQQLESRLNDVIDSNARFVILPFGAHAGIVNANHLALREMVERLISRRVDSSKNIELREERAFRGGAAMARTLPVNVEELHTVLDALREVREITLPGGHKVTSHGLNSFAVIRSYLTGAGEDAIDASALTQLLFTDFDALVENTPALKNSEYWQAMIDAVNDIRKRNGSEAAGLVFLAYMDGFLQEALARAYPKDGQFADPAYETAWKKLFLDMDSLLVRKEGRYTVLSGAQNEDMETFINMKMVEHLTVVGRADFAEKLLLDTARSINNEKFSGTLGSTMFVEAVARYLTKKNLTPQDLRSLLPVLTRQQLLNRENREFLLSRYGNTPSIVDAVKKVMKDYEKKGTLTIGEQGYYRNASKIMERIIVDLASDDRELTAYASLISNITRKTDTAIGNWKETAQPDISIEDSIKNHLFASLTLSHNGDMLNGRNLMPMMPRLTPGNMRASLFLSSELQMVKIPGIIKKNLPARKTDNEIRMALQPLLSVHERYGTIPLTLSEEGGNTEPDKPADPVTTAGILEILQVRAERKMKDAVIKAFNVSIEANKAILYAS